MIDEPTDLLDTFWGCFLHDYEDKYSVGDDVVWENESQIRDELDSRADCSGEDYSSSSVSLGLANSASYA